MDLNNLKSEPLVVLGGGFGGLSTVIALLAHAEETPIILIDQSPRFLFKPLLYELLSNELQLWEVAPKYSTLASELGFIFLQESVVQLDPLERKLITLSDLELTYSQLVISTGLTTDYSITEGLKEYACGFSNLNDVTRIKKLINSINNSFEYKNNPLVISGAGPTGVELACKIADLVDDSIEIFLVEKGEKVLPNSQSFNREKAIDAMSKRNIKIYLEYSIKSVNKNFLELSSACDQRNNLIKIDYSGLLWTAGLKNNSSKLLNQFLNINKKVEVNDFLQSDASQNIFFVGDITFNKKNPFPSSAQAAMQQGFITAQNIISIKKGNKLKSFQFEDMGEMLSLGIGNASITGYGMTLVGPLAFEIRRLAYLFKMPSVALSFRSSGAWLFRKKFINRLFSQYL